MRRTAIAMLVCAALLPGGCKKKKAEDKKTGDPAAVQAMDSDMARPAMDARRKDAPRRAAARRAAPMPDKISIKLVDAGKGKKQKLRYQFALGKSHTMVMDMLMENRLKVSGRVIPVNMPKMRYTLNIKVDKGSAAGWSKFNIGGLSISFPDPPQGMQGKAIVAAMGKAKDALGKMKFSYEMNDRGFFKGIVIETPPDAPAPMKAMMQQIGGSMKQSMMFSSVPLPDEPVGVGARWTAVIPMTLPMMKFVAHMEFVVKKLEGDKVTLAMKMKGEAPKQKMALPGGKGFMDLDKLDTKAEGTMTLNMTIPVPEGNLVSETAMAGKAGGHSMDMAMKVKMTFKAGK